MNKKRRKEINANIASILKDAEGYLTTIKANGARRRSISEWTEDMSNKTPQDQTQEIIDRLVTPERQRQVDSVFDRLVGRVPPRESPPDDMPALEKIKLYARSGYHLHHIGTDDNFERVWSDAFTKDEEDSKS